MRRWQFVLGVAVWAQVALSTETLDSTAFVTRESSARYSEDYGAARAIDGQLGTAFVSKDNSVDPYWASTFDREYFVTKVVVYHRSDCCSGRFTDVALTLYTAATLVESSPASFEGVVANPAGHPRRATWTVGVPASAIRISMSGRKILEVAEVHVFVGTPQPTPPPTATPTATCVHTVTATASRTETATASTAATDTAGTATTTQRLSTTHAVSVSDDELSSLSVTFSLPATLTASIRPAASYRRVGRVLSDTEGQAVAATGVAAAVVSVAAGPGAAVTANRALVTAHLLRCSVLADDTDAALEAPEFTEHPLRVGLGSGPLAAFRGAAVLNLALVLAAGCVGIVSSPLVFDIVLLQRMSLFAAATLWAVLTTPTFRACTVVLRFDTAPWQAAAALVMLGSAGLVVALHAALVRRVRPTLCGMDAGTCLHIGGLQRFVCPMKEWRDTAMARYLGGGEAAHGATPVPYRARLGRCHDDYTAVTFMTWEWAFSAVAGVLSGLYPSSQAGCRALATATCLLFATYAVVCLTLRYYIVRPKVVAMCVVAVLQCVGMAAVTWQLFEGRSAHGATVVAFCIVLSESVAALEQIVEAAAWVVYRHEAALSGSATSSSDESDGTTANSECNMLGNPLLVVIADDSETETE